MSSGNSREIESGQVGVHENLAKLVTRHLLHSTQKPYNQHTLEAFQEVQEWLGDWRGELILDSCCGVGESTAIIAQQHPQAKVIGVDKSALRINKHSHYAASSGNYRVVRADLNDFWRLAIAAKWQLFRHYLLYPNPYPKASQLHKRWHASAAFADIIKLGGQLEVRSNWQVYVQEFAAALKVAEIDCKAMPYSHELAITPFERKYWASGQSSWHLIVQLS
jgi:tRNA G46 methylase TrmB